MTKGKKIGLALFGLLVAVVVVAVLWPKEQQDTRETMTLMKSTVTQTVDMTGSLVYPQSRRAGFMVSGRIETLHVAVGDTVHAGQVLATLEDPMPEVANDAYRLPSPIDGVVTAVYAYPGDVVGAGTPVVVVQGPVHTFEVTVEATENDVVALFVGDEATIVLDAVDDVTFMGTILAIAPTATTAQGVVTYTVRIGVERVQNGEKGAWSQLREGMTADVAVETARATNVLAVPRRAVTVRDGVSYVRVIAENEDGYEEREVATGLRGDDGMLVVTDGLSEGDEIIVRME